MERIAYKIALDVTKAESQKFLTGFSVGENRARVLKITLNNGRNPVHFDGSETISMFVTKPSDTSPSIGLCYLEGDTIVYNVLQSDVSEEGPTRFSIKVEQIEDNLITVLYAAHFTIQVTDPECDDSHAPDDPNFSILEALIAEVEQFDSDAEAFAIGTRGGVPVTEDDPAYHMNAKWFAENLEVEVEEQVERAEAWAVGTKGGVPVEEGDPSYQNNSKFYKEQAATSATNAATSESNAATSESNASGSASSASASSLKAEGYAVGTQNGTPAESGEPYYHDNSKFYKEQAATSATNAATSESNASGSASAASGSASSASASSLEAEGYAKGTQGGTPVTSGSPYFEANAKFYKEQAATSATNAATSESNASGSASAASGSANTASQKALDSEAWAEGTRGGVPVGPGDPTYEKNAKYWAEQASAGQIQADWNQADNTKKDYIKNKPTIPDAQIQSDWDQADNTKKDFIKNKPTIPSTAADISLVTTGTSLPGTVDDLQKLAEYMFPPGVTVSLTLNGAKNDIITIKDSNDQTVATCTFTAGQTSGSVQFAVPVGGGTYKFISSVAKDTTTGTSDYEKTVVLTDAVSQTVNVYPKNALYWYGNYIVGFTRESIQPNLSKTDLTNALEIHWNTSSIGSGAYYTDNPIDLSPYSKIKLNCIGISGTIRWFGEITSPNANSNNPTAIDNSNTTTGIKELDISSVTTSDYVGILLGGSTDNAAYITVSALWLDDGHEDDLTIHGAKEDTITITDSQNQTVATCVFDSGKTYGYVSKALLPSGTYKFTSSVAKDTTNGTSDYEKTITLDGSENEVDVFPDNCLYWFGNEMLAATGGWYATRQLYGGTVTKNTNNFVLSTVPSGGTANAYAETTSQYDFTALSTLKILKNNDRAAGASGARGAWIHAGVDGAGAELASSDFTTTGLSWTSITIQQVGDNKGYTCCKNWQQSVSASMTVYALYAE